VAVDELSNFFLIKGRNSRLFTGSLLSVFDVRGDYVVKVLRRLQKDDYATIEVRPELVAQFNQYRTVYTSECSSWYQTGRINSRIVATWPRSLAQCLEVLQAPRWEDFMFESAYYPTGNSLRWIGNGSSLGLAE
ncbi:hypothetical protein BGZ61DRAFT_374838, partial [Ilyonectria robusta]|uniref:uncharacterized protein n=1 Tax=Ilyonectria robusta TaxID=1079257 RepID=UPI001E8EB592